MKVHRFFAQIQAFSPVRVKFGAGDFHVSFLSVECWGFRLFEKCLSWLEFFRVVHVGGCYCSVSLRFAR